MDHFDLSHGSVAAPLLNVPYAKPVDFTQRWKLGHSLARQARCYSLYKGNGAMNLGAVLRNIDILAWIDFDPAFNLYHCC
ncbi:hypothetical protein THRCLA_21875 [Thraustotheca clavata]|uniref:Uncharacterized protein n=1 Tax=Thraustotheca clavata TaxID=74557 RepID=A0A1V9ZLU7_9STRA|nr:hypothetical protein THRCLA_21875 [Thraustotheca clavata]